MLKRLSVFGLAIGLAMVVGGCDRGELANNAHAEPLDNASHPVAVLDLDRVARETGMTEKISQTVQEQGKQWRQQLQENQDKAEQRIRTLAQDMGDAPTQRQQQAFARERANLATQLNRQQQFAQRNIAGLQARLGNSFADAVRPIARQVSGDEGADAVFLAGGTLYTFDEAIDITDEVLIEVRRRIEAGQFEWSVENEIEKIKAERQAALEQQNADQNGGGDAATP